MVRERYLIILADFSTDTLIIVIGELATFDKLLLNVEKLDKKGGKEIKGFVKAALEHFQSSVKKIQETKYAEALQELKKLCSETSKVFEACKNKVK